MACINWIEQYFITSLNLMALTGTSTNTPIMTRTVPLYFYHLVPS